jgi:oligoendopeptidase F
MYITTCHIRFHTIYRLLSYWSKAMSDNAALGALPEWDLSDLYPGMESKELARDLKDMATAATEFSDHFKEKVADLTTWRELSGATKK